MEYYPFLIETFILLIDVKKTLKDIAGQKELFWRFNKIIISVVIATYLIICPFLNIISFIKT